MEKVPMVSAIITTYNRGLDVVFRAVNSVLRQTYENIELIVINDCPQEQVLHEKIKQKLDSLGDSRVKYICHEVNKGACAARNTGILESKGDYIAFLDDDDEWVSNKIEIMYKNFDSKIGLVYSSFYLEEVNKKKIVTRGNKSGAIKNEMLCKNLISGTSMPMIRSRCFQECGMFDTNLLSSQDYDMWMRIVLKYEVKYIDCPLTIRHFSTECITVNINNRKQGWDYFTNKYMEYYNMNRYAYNYRLNAIVNAAFSIGEFNYGFEKYKLALKVRLTSRQNILCPIKGIIKYMLNRRYQ